jgi:uncharacterized protein (DUF58 family)
VVPRQQERSLAPVSGFLDPAVLGRIDNLELLARTVVDGFLHGLHRSPYLGLSLDFAEHRAYEPGDDIRLIDWRLFARTDRHYIKQFEAETNANFVVVLDVSRSMSYGSHETTKLDYARYLAACLAYFSRKQGDRVGLFTFDSAIVEYVPPSLRHLDVLLHTLDRATAGSPGTLQPFGRMGETLSRRGILVVISDFYEEPDRVLAAMNDLRHRGHDVIAFPLLDPAELTFPFDRPSSFHDLETGEEIPVVPDKLRAEYTALVQAHVRELERLFSANRMDYVLLDTSKPLDHALFRYLSTRQRLSRTR